MMAQFREHPLSMNRPLACMVQNVCLPEPKKDFTLSVFHCTDIEVDNRYTIPVNVKLGDDAGMQECASLILLKGDLINTLL